MSGDKIEITVTCPSDRARSVAERITLDTGCSTRLNDAHGELVIVSAPDGTVATLEAVAPSSGLCSETIPVGKRGSDNRDGNARPDVEHDLSGHAAVKHRGFQAQAGDGPVTGIDDRLRNPNRMLWEHSEALTRVLHHVSRLANRRVKFSRIHASPSSVGSTPSVGEWPGPGGNPAGPGHSDGGAR